MSKKLKRAAKEAGLVLKGWDLSDLEIALQEQALRIVQHVAQSDDPKDDREAKGRARLLEMAAGVMAALAESKNKRVRATETLMRAEEIKHKLKVGPSQQTNTIVLTPGQDAREMVFEVLMNRVQLPPRPPVLEAHGEEVPPAPDAPMPDAPAFDTPMPDAPPGEAPVGEAPPA